MNIYTVQKVKESDVKDITGDPTLNRANMLLVGRWGVFSPEGKLQALGVTLSTACLIADKLNELEC